MTESLTERLSRSMLDLFGHRSDVFAEQQDSGVYLPVQRELTEDEVSEHLAGFSSYGVYTTRPDDQSVGFICWDLDTHDEDALDTLTSLVSRFVLGTGHLDCTCLLLESSGNKGSHVWLFLDAPVSAAAARRWVQRDFMPQWKEAGFGAIEVFPKQDGVAEGGLGNLVKLPLGKHRVSGRFSEVHPYHGWAEAIESVHPFPASLVPEVPAEEIGSRRRKDEHRVSGDGPNSRFPCIDQILYNGVGSGTRNQALFHLALYLFDNAIPEDLALEICQRANENFEPPLSERELSTSVSQAYSGRYYSASCGSDWLGDLCPGPCKGGWKVKADTDDSELRNAGEGQAVEVEVVRRQKDGNRTRVTVSHPDAANTPTFVCS